MNDVVTNAGEKAPSSIMLPGQKFESIFSTAIRVYTSENALVANNKMKKSTADFVMHNYKLRGTKMTKNVTYDFDNRYGIDVNRVLFGAFAWSWGGSYDNPSTKATSPYYYVKGVTIRDNDIYSTGRVGIIFSGDGTKVTGNHIYVHGTHYTPMGMGLAKGSSTDESRGIDFAGANVVIDHNNIDVAHTLIPQDGTTWPGKYTSFNDGEGILEQAHVATTVAHPTITNNITTNYIGLFDMTNIHGADIENNTVTNPNSLGIFVVADTGKPYKAKDVTIKDNTTASGITFSASAGAANIHIDENKTTHSSGISFTGGPNGTNSNNEIIGNNGDGGKITISPSIADNALTMSANKGYTVAEK